MKTGKVKWYNPERGYGFIESDDEKDIFVHRTGLTKPFEILEPGQEVTFELQQGDRGPSAINVSIRIQKDS